MTERLADQPARDTIATSLGTTYLVEAAAGTGKTTSLVSRMVALVRTGTCPVDTMAAITFTIKAAAHLREAFQEALEEAMKTAKGDELRRLTDARASMERGFIGTIHAFCARLLRERPVEAGLDPEFEEVSEEEQRTWPKAFWMEHVERLSAEGDESLVRLAEVGLRASQLAEPFARLVDYPDVEFVTEATPRPDLRGVLAAIEPLLERAGRELPDAVYDSEKEKLPSHLIEMHKRLETLDRTDLSRIADFLDRFDTSHGVTLKNWEDRDLAYYVRDTYRDLKRDTVRPAIERWREHLHSIVLDVLVPALNAFRRERLQAGRLTFQDLLMESRDLLRDHAHVRDYFAGRFTHVLVDEFQDTDPIQAEILFYLTGTDHAEPSWKKLAPRPGSLFIVGDPKQSIYRFRRADITTYLEVRALIEKSGGKTLRLTSNFRSMSSVCDHVNTVFASVFAGEDVREGRQAEHVALAPTREDGALCGVRQMIDPGTKREDVARSNAAEVSEWIRAAVANGIDVVEKDGKTRAARWGDFLLISRTKKQLAAYTGALEARGIPYEITGGMAFVKSAEIAPLLVALRAIAEPDDEVAVAAFLRGPFCGVTDQALFEHVQKGGSFNWRLPANDGHVESIGEGLKVLRDAAEWARELPPATVVAKLSGRLVLAPWAATGEKGLSRAGNVRKLALLARELSKTGRSFAEVVDELLRMVEEETDIEELSIDPARRDVVRVMNLHQVKGLEAPFVFLIDPGPTPNWPVELYVDRKTDPPGAHVALTKKYGQGNRTIAQPRNWKPLQDLEDAFQSCEESRLLYVAATRARQLLVVTATTKANGSYAGCWSPLLSGPVTPLGTLARPDSSRSEPQRSEGESRDLQNINDNSRLSPQAERRTGVTGVSTDRRPPTTDRFLAASTPTYSVTPITKLAHEGATLPAHAEESRGKGTSWGRVLHRLLEAMMKDDTVDVGRLATNLLRDEEREMIELEEVLRLAKAVEQSDLWQRARNADEYHVEVPFAIEVPTSSMTTPPLIPGTSPLILSEAKDHQPINPREARSSPPSPSGRGAGGEGDPQSAIRNPQSETTLLHGTIDLVFREADTWTIVDYKSDDTTDRLDALVDYYAPQVRHYAAYWSNITKQPTKAALFFVDTATMKPIDL